MKKYRQLIFIAITFLPLFENTFQYLKASSFQTLKYFTSHRGPNHRHHSIRKPGPLELSRTYKDPMHPSLSVTKRRAVSSAVSLFQAAVHQQHNLCIHRYQLQSVECKLGYLPLPGSCSLATVSVHCLLYTSPSPRDSGISRMPSSA